MRFLHAPQLVIQAAPAGPLRCLMMAGAFLLFSVGAVVAIHVSKHLGALSAVHPDPAVRFWLFLLSVLATVCGAALAGVAVLQISSF